MKEYSGRLPQKQFNQLLLMAPIPCVDLIIRRENTILIGKRQIIPLKKKWALIGGRILKNELPEETCERQLKSLGIKATKKSFVGVFPAKWGNHPQKRYDISLCYIYDYVSGEPDDPTGELLYFTWEHPDNLPNMPKHYMNMIKAAKL
jgi:ADP-ribose pyrophosphatase YjhB (NUDIX family)